MEAIAIPHIQERIIIERPKFKIYTRKRPYVKRAPQPDSLYPKIIMPEQPEQYIRQRKNDCL
jgi:hypothetical protein